MPQFLSFFTMSNCHVLRDRVVGGCYLKQILLYWRLQLSPEKEEADKKQFGSRPCHFSASAAVCINWGAATDETTFCTFLMPKLLVGKAKHSQSSNLVWAWKVNKQKSGHIIRDWMKGKETFLAKVVICSRSRKQSKITQFAPRR